MRCSVYLLLLLVCGLGGCASTSPNGPRRGVAPPIPTPAPLDPGQSPPPGAIGPGLAPPPGTIQVPPPGVAPTTSLPPNVNPNSPESARVQATAARLYQANTWLTVRPRWFVAEGNGPGVATTSEQTIILSGNLVRAASDGQLAAVMSIQLGDLMVARQRSIIDQSQANKQRATSAPPDYLQMSPGQSSTLALLQLDEYAKNHYDPRDKRRQEKQQQQQPLYDSPMAARQMLVNAGYSELELNQAAPLLQQFQPSR